MRNVIVVIVYGSISDSRSIPIARYILLIDCFRVRCSSCLKGCFSSLSVSPVDDTLTLLIRRCRVLLLIHSTDESSFIVHDSFSFPSHENRTNESNPLALRSSREKRNKGTRAILSSLGRLTRNERKERNHSVVLREKKQRNESNSFVRFLFENRRRGTNDQN